MIEDLNNQKEKWESQQKIWEEMPFFSIHDKENILMNWLKQIPKGKILDEGCGIGRYTIPLSQLGFDAIGLDFSQKLLDVAKKNAKKYKAKCRFVKGDIRKLPFKDKTFDAILSAGTIEHVPETEKAISELSRILKPKGYLIIHVPHKISTFTLLKKFQQIFGLWKLGYEKSFSIFGFSNLLSKYNFEILQMQISEFKAGRHKFIGKLIQIIDKPLYKLGLGGHQMCFLCQKSK